MKKINSTIQKLHKKSFARLVSFNFIPPLYFECLLEALIDNPYLNKIGAKKELAGVTIEDTSYEGWQLYPRKYIIKDDKIITQILNDGERNIKILKTKILTINKSLPKLKTATEISSAVSEMHLIGKKLSYGNALLNEECILTSDKQLLERLPHIRQEISVELISPIWKAFDMVLRILENKYAVSKKIIERLRYCEIIEELNKKNPFQKLSSSVAQRSVAFVLLENKINCYFNNDVYTLKNYLGEQDPDKKFIQEYERTKTIRGTSAFSGKERGKVIILKAEDYANVSNILKNKKEFILVTPMTRPESILYIKSAKAFVTDEGGITSHAAIVAREMKKPCIIGTKIATRVLKNGDLVEVDADNGIVRKV